MSSTAEVFKTHGAVRDAVDPHRIESLPILVLSPHNRCNCRCLMCDIWKIRQAREITAGDLASHIESLRVLKVRWVVLSGGEALMHSDLPALCRVLHGEGMRVTLLTAGLLLESQAPTVTQHLDDIIVSLDGPPEIHDRIRGLPRTFERLARGVSALRLLRPEMPIQARCTVQKENHHYLRETVRAARELDLNSISFLAVDVTSEAFNRPEGWPAERQSRVALDASQVESLDDEVEALIRDCRREIASGFVAEDDEKLRRIVLHFRTLLGQAQPIAPRCNAPWVSAVVESDGTVRPCFFHPPLGNLNAHPLYEIVNSPEALRFRRHLDVATNPICRRCVCSLFLPDAKGV